MKTLYISDMDGTLFDTQKIFVPAWDIVGEKYGFKNMGKHIPAVCGVNPKGSDEYLKNNFPGLDTVAFKSDVKDYVEKNMVVKFMSGAPELLGYLKNRGIKVALATGTSRKSTESHLEEMGLADYFDATVCGNEIVNGKPAPDVFLKAAELLGAEPEDCFVFEDSLNGLKAAFAANMKGIGVPDVVEFTDEDRKIMYAEIKSLDEAIEIFEKLSEEENEN